MRVLYHSNIYVFQHLIYLNQRPKLRKTVVKRKSQLIKNKLSFAFQVVKWVKYRLNGCKQKVNNSDSDGTYLNRQLFGSI